MLGDVTGRVGRAAIHLAGVLAAEGTTTVGTFTTVGIHDDLAAGEAGIAVGATDHELAGGVDVIGNVVSEQALHALWQLLLHAGNEDLDDVLLDLRQHHRLLVEVVVLCAHHNGVDAHGLAVVSVLDGHLALGVGAQVGHLAVLLAAYGGEFAQQHVAELQRQRHVVVGVAAGVAEHHALITGTLLLGILALHTLVDVGALLVDGAEDPAAVRLEHVLALGVADLADHLAGDLLHIEVGLALHLAGQHHLSGGH